MTKRAVAKPPLKKGSPAVLLLSWLRDLGNPMLRVRRMNLGVGIYDTHWRMLAYVDKRGTIFSAAGERIGTVEDPPAGLE